MLRRLRSTALDWFAFRSQWSCGPMGGTRRERAVDQPVNYSGSAVDFPLTFNRNWQRVDTVRILRP